MRRRCGNLQDAGGPKIDMQYGRDDCPTEDLCVAEGNLPGVPSPPLNAPALLVPEYVRPLGPKGSNLCCSSSAKQPVTHEDGAVSSSEALGTGYAWPRPTVGNGSNF